VDEKYEYSNCLVNRREEAGAGKSRGSRKKEERRGTKKRRTKKEGVRIDGLVAARDVVKGKVAEREEIKQGCLLILTREKGIL